MLNSDNDLKLLETQLSQTHNFINYVSHSLDDYFKYLIDMK